jgi:hypothetical protein
MHGSLSIKNVEQSSDKINSLICASCWDFYIGILLLCTDPCILKIGDIVINQCSWLCGVLLCGSGFRSFWAVVNTAMNLKLYQGRSVVFD